MIGSTPLPHCQKCYSFSDFYCTSTWSTSILYFNWFVHLKFLKVIWYMKYNLVFLTVYSYRGTVWRIKKTQLYQNFSAKLWDKLSTWIHFKKNCSKYGQRAFLNPNLRFLCQDDDKYFYQQQKQLKKDYWQRKVNINHKDLVFKKTFLKAY